VLQVSHETFCKLGSCL